MKFYETFINKSLREIGEKVEQQIPVDEDDARIMLETDDILELGEIAAQIRRRLHGKKTYYGVNMNLNYTNVCLLRCPLCAFSCEAGDANEFLVSFDEAENRVREAVTQGVEEVHIVGGIRSDLKLEYFEELLRRIKAIKPDIFIVAFSAVEYDYFATLNQIPLEEVFQRLIAAGVGALPGGGAEIFAEEKRAILAPKKISGERWLEVMRTAHKLGLKTNATMLYNHIENDDDIIDHLFRLRKVQDETGGFKTFVPLQFHEENTGIKAKKKSTTGYDDIKIYATSRIVLHNIPHIKALWMYLGEGMAQTLQSFGVDDIGATYNNEKVVHAAGAKTPDFGSETFLRRLISSAGFEPIRTTADYN